MSNVTESAELQPTTRATQAQATKYGEWMGAFEAGCDEGDNARRARLRTLKTIEDLFGRAACLDPVSAEPVTAEQWVALARVREAIRNPGGVPMDRLARIAQVADEALRWVAEHPNTCLRRRRVMLPAHKVRAMDSRTEVWLARQPGRSGREKARLSRRLLAVVREPSINIPENRLAARLMRNLRQCLGNAVMRVRSGDSDTVALRLSALADFYDGRWAHSGLAGLEDERRIRPNNVLLRHRYYARLWRAWRMLVGSAGTYAELDASLERSLACAVYWAVVADLAGRAGVQPVIDFGRASVGEVDEPVMGLVTLGTRTPLVFRMDECTALIVDLTPPDDEHPTTCRGTVYLAMGDALLVPQKVESFGIATELVDDARVMEDRGIPIRVVVTMEHAVRPHSAFGDRSGLAEIVTRVIDDLRLSVGDGQCEHEAQPQAGTLATVGWDLGTSRARIVSGDGKREFPMIGIEWDLGPAGLRWVVGAQALRARRVDGRSVVLGHREMWKASRSGNGRRGMWEPLRAAFAESVAVLGWMSGYGIRAAVVLADDFDLVNWNGVRGVGAANGATPTFVWRSVAAALGWRETGEWDAVRMAPADTLLVVDGDASGDGLPRLTARVAPCPDDWRDGPWDGWEWVREVPLATRGCGRAPTWSGVVWDCAREDLSKIDDAVVRAHISELAALAGQLCEEPNHSNVVWLPLLPDDAAQSRIVRVDLRRIAERAAVRFVSDFGVWWSQCAREPGARDSLGGERVHLLATGRPFDDDAVWTAVMRVVSEATPNVRCHRPHEPLFACAAGARAALERAAKRLPTWSEYLPELYLEVDERTSVGMERKQICIFPRQRVQLGALVRWSCEGRFVLGRGRDKYEMPLTRKEEGRDRRRCFAEISPERPLAEDVRCQLRVDFRYASDAFRIYVEPVIRAQMEAIEVEWREDVGAQGGETCRNVVPAYPAAEPWDECGIEPAVEALIGAVAEVETILRKEAFNREWVLRTRGRSQSNQVRGDWHAVIEAALQRALDALSVTDARARELWSVRRTGQPLPAEWRERVELGAFSTLEDLAGVPHAEASRRESLREPRRLRGGDMGRRVERLISQLEVRALGILARAGCAAPVGTAARAVEMLKQCDEKRQADAALVASILRSLGRMMASETGQSDGRVMLDVMDYGARCLDRMNEGARVAQELAPAVWALATGSWGSEGLILEISAEVASDLIGLVKNLLAWLDVAPPAGPSREIAQETMLVLLALLRRRSDGSEWLRAGGAEAGNLAADVERIDRRLGIGANPRVRIESERRADSCEEGGSPLGRELVACLRGARAARIRFEEERA